MDALLSVEEAARKLGGLSKYTIQAQFEFRQASTHQGRQSNDDSRIRSFECH